MLAKALQGATAAADKLYIESVFSTYLYTGNDSTQTITNGIDLSGKGGLVWTKARTANINSWQHDLEDTVRGAGNYLQSNNTVLSQFNSNAITGFSASGYSIGSINWLNRSGENYASWTFRKAAKFFDVVTWTGDGTANRRISHSLESVPGCIVVKQTSANGGNAYPADWFVWHRTYAESYNYQKLNATDAVIGSGGSYPFPFGSLPTSTTFGVQSAAESYGRTNATGETYVAYLFAHDAGGFGTAGTDSVVKCGSFTQSTSTVSVNLGWEPQWVLIKSSSIAGSWYLFDNMRGMPASPDQYWSGLRANTTATESSATIIAGVNTTGFTVNGDGGGGLAAGDYIYIAIRRGPMKKPTDATKVFSAITATASTGTSRIIGFPSDLIWARRRNALNSPQAVDRLRGLATSSSSTTQPTFDMAVNTNAESTGGSATVYDVWNDTAKDGSYFNGQSTIWHHFRRAPGFFDVVAYTGTGSATTVSHNLGVVPELMIVKRRDSTSSVGWISYVASLGNQARIQLNLSDAATTGSATIWNSTSPTGSVFTVGAATDINGSGGTYIAYLFATCPGVSKVGSYTGTGTTLSIDCGFTAGARFVMIKRTDSTGDWYVWDTARGIISGNDPYLLLNSTAAEVTNTDYIDPLSSGFQISSTAPAAINNNGGSFIFLAIA